MARPKVRTDDSGINVVTNGQTYRPGAVGGHGHAIRMDDGGLVPGDTVLAYPVEGTERLRLKLADGTTTYWFAEGHTRARGLMDAPAGAVWKTDGRRDFRTGVIIG